MPFSNRNTANSFRHVSIDGNENQIKGPAHQCWTHTSEFINLANQTSLRAAWACTDCKFISIHLFLWTQNLHIKKPVRRIDIWNTPPPKKFIKETERNQVVKLCDNSILSNIFMISSWKRSPLSACVLENLVESSQKAHTTLLDPRKGH